MLAAAGCNELGSYYETGISGRVFDAIVDFASLTTPQTPRRIPAAFESDGPNAPKVARGADRRVHGAARRVLFPGETARIGGIPKGGRERAWRGFVKCFREEWLMRRDTIRGGWGRARARATGNRRFLAVLGAVLLAGCGSKVVLGPLNAEFDRYVNETQALEPEGSAQDMLGQAEGRRDEARQLERNGKQAALPVMKTALADARLALHLAQLQVAQSSADACLREVEVERQKWQDAFRMLEQTESVVSRTAPLSRKAPDFPALDPLPPTAIGTPEPPQVAALELGTLWETWKAEAATRRVSTVDLENDFRVHAARAADKDVKAEGRAQHVYIAGRLIQCLECRVREEIARNTCRRSASLIQELADGRDAARQATLDLERGLQDDLRSQLDEVRRDARDRQGELYDALSSIEGKYARITQEARGTIVSLADILFDFDKATLKRDVEFNLVRIATILQQFPEMGIAVEGHTDNIGREEYNLDLSRRRAKAVYDFLVSQGIDPIRMVYEGYGMTRPVEDNSTDAGRARNRRVDLVIKDQ